MRYLSLEWIEALGAAVADSAAMQSIAADHPMGITQVVTDGPEGNVIYHVQVADGSAGFGSGPAWPEDVRFEQDWTTAVAVATGTLNAQEAFIGGKIRLFGDQQKLMANQPVFHALDEAFNSVREHTTYE